MGGDALGQFDGLRDNDETEMLVCWLTNRIVGSGKRRIAARCPLAWPINQAWPKVE